MANEKRWVEGHLVIGGAPYYRPRMRPLLEVVDISDDLLNRAMESSDRSHQKLKQYPIQPQKPDNEI